MKNNLIAIIIVVVLIVGAGAFFAGMKYQKNQQPTRQSGSSQGTRGNGQGGANRSGFRPVSGEIIASDDKSITVKLQDGSSKIVLVGDSTTINKSDQAAKSDLKQGEKVAVFGMENSDGSVTAQNIQLNPQLRGMPPASPN